MAGVKGKSGGARQGAGRKKNPENEGVEYAESTVGKTPVEVLEFFMHHESVPVALRLKAAGLAAPFRHKKLGEGKAPGATEPTAPQPGSKYATRSGPRSGTTH